MMSFFVLTCLVYAYTNTATTKRLIWLLIAFLAAISITHLSQGRTGYVLLAVALLTFSLSVLRKKALWLAMLFLSLGIGLALISSPVLSKRVNQAIVEFQRSDSDNTSSIGHRLYNYEKTIELIREKPLFGGGTGSYHIETCIVIGDPERCLRYNSHPHNQFLFFGADHGMLGILAYVALLSSLLWLALKDRNTESRVLLLGLTVLLAVNSLINSPLWSARESHFFFLMMALLAARSYSFGRSRQFEANQHAQIMKPHS